MSRVIALFVMAAVAGCAATTPEAQPSPTVDPKVQQQRVEAVKADCMKQKGFTYTAFVWPEPTEDPEIVKGRSGDYALMKTYREKYGFGVFSMIVHPGKFGARARSIGEDSPDPNHKIMEKLSEKQRMAYQDASEACYGQAVKQVLGKDVKGVFDHYEKTMKAMEQLRTRELNGDAKLVELAAATATCLQDKGYKVDSSQPVAVAKRGRDEFGKEMSKFQKEMGGGGKGMGKVVALEITPEQAKPLLDKEIKAALDDLECGKAFYAEYQPKSLALQTRVKGEYGVDVRE
ncbi:hypothetical protein ACIBH1_00580 [Nonomuraea sp. NPDC050663]|uniref:hypothetical protein n=1 Tax=Nonomuraea sp. NPDC050663 TaxID=3364370 RepID=UPI0037B81AE8